MNTKLVEHVEGLSLSIGNHEIGLFSHYSGRKNIFLFSPNYIHTLAKDWANRKRSHATKVTMKNNLYLT